MSKGYEKLIEEAVSGNDSLGGIVKITVNNLPVGLGEPYFDKVDALLARGYLVYLVLKGYRLV